MFRRPGLVVALILFPCAQTVFAQSALPPKMEGRWHNADSKHSDRVEVELIRMESPTEALVRVIWHPYCPLAETKAQFADGVWKIIPQGCPKDLNISAKVRPVEGRNRMEGAYGSRPGRTVYLEWQ
jgi:hypothetical protein